MPCASPCTRSAARADAKRTKTAWAIATRGTRACSRSPTAWAAILKARSPRSWRCRRWPRCSSATPSRRCRTRCASSTSRSSRAHHQLLRYATQKALIDTPRTTVVACLLQGNAAYWAHCGDSRLYMVRGDKLIARTRDHSYSELQETMSQVVPMGEKFNRNVLFTCLGSPGKPVVDTVGPLLLQAGDRLLLCSDGLWGSVSDTEIVDQLSKQRRSPTRCPNSSSRRCATVVAKSDNVSVLAVEWEAAEETATAPMRHLDAVSRRGGLRLDDPGQRDGHRRARRAGRRRDRAFDPRDQRSDPPLVAAEEVLTALLAVPAPLRAATIRP